MTVVKLIEKLQNLPLDAEILLKDQMDNEFRLYDVDLVDNKVILS